MYGYSFVGKEEEQKEEEEEKEEVMEKEKGTRKGSFLYLDTIRVQKLNSANDRYDIMRSNLLITGSEIRLIKTIVKEWKEKGYMLDYSVLDKKSSHLCLSPPSGLLNKSFYVLISTGNSENRATDVWNDLTICDFPADKAERDEIEILFATKRWLPLIVDFRTICQKFVRLRW